MISQMPMPMAGGAQLVPNGNASIPMRMPTPMQMPMRMPTPMQMQMPTGPSPPQVGSQHANAAAAAAAAASSASASASAQGGWMMPTQRGVGGAMNPPQYAMPMQGGGFMVGGLPMMPPPASGGLM